MKKYIFSLLFVTSIISTIIINPSCFCWCCDEKEDDNDKDSPRLLLTFPEAPNFNSESQADFSNQSRQRNDDVSSRIANHGSFDNLSDEKNDCRK